MHATSSLLGRVHQHTTSTEPTRLQGVVSYIEVEYQIRERHACTPFGVGQLTYRYRARKGTTARGE